MASLVTKSPFRRELPALKCTVCGSQHCTTQVTTESKLQTGQIISRCLYCGRSHRLDGKRWVRA